MCQTNNKLVKLRKDRVVYKVEELIYGKWVTFVQNAELKRNCIIEAHGEPKPLYGSDIYGGFFHCIANKKDVRSYAVWYKERNPDEVFRIIKVIVPAKDNLIYKGKFCDEYNSLCARKIILTDEVIWESK